MTTLGSSIGGSASLVGNRFAARLSGAKAEVSPTFDGIAADARFALQQRVSRVSVCPLLEVSYLRATQDRGGFSTSAITGFTSQTASIRGGLSLGMQQQLPRGFGVIPFVATRYEFTVLYFDPQFDASAGEAEAAGDTLSAIDVAYGATVTYKQWHAGWAARRSSERPGRAHVATLFVGFAWGRREAKSSR